MKGIDKEKITVSVLLSIFIALGVYYIFSNPLYCKPDEVYHQSYVEHLLAGNGLPKIDVERAITEDTYTVEMEGHQPPLYYATVAGIASLFGLDNQYSPSPNPHFLSTDIGNYNTVVPVYLQYPLKEQPLFYAGRCISLLCGVGALIATYLLTRRFLPWSMAALIISFMGLNPQFIFIATSFSNDMAGVFLIHVALWQLSTSIEIDLTYRHGALLGFIIGLATLAKLTGLGLLAPLAGIVLWQFWKTRRITLLGTGILAGFVTLGLNSWWFLRNWRLYNNPFATNLLTVLIGERSTPLQWQEIHEFLSFLWKAYWLDFSVGGIVFANEWVYYMIGALFAISIIGTGMAISRRPALRPITLLLWGWLGIVFISLIQLTTKTAIWMGGGRLLFPAAVTVAFTLTVGLLEILHSLPLVGFLATLFGIFAVMSPSLYLHHAYPRPIPHSHVAKPSTQPANVNFADTFLLLSYDLKWSEKETENAKIEITYRWKTTQQTPHNFSLFIHLYTEREGTPNVLSQVDTYPRYGSLPTNVWHQNQVLIDQIELHIPEMKPKTQAEILTGLYYYPNMERLPVSYGNDEPLHNRALSMGEIQVDEAGDLNLITHSHEDER
jgi:4-amino-4-deoxy-L-arabinose transferase-like glycosyltransferase